MRPIAALATALKPDLTIVDSICGDLNFEEGGNPVPTGRMMLGTDPVQLDAYGCRLMGLDLDQVPYIGLAEGWGAGTTKVEPGGYHPASTSPPPPPSTLPPPARWPPSPETCRPRAPAPPAMPAWCGPCITAVPPASPSPSARAGGG